MLGDFPQLRWTRYAGPGAGDARHLNDAANWSAPETIGPRSDANTELSLMSGPSGIYLGYAVTAGAGGARLRHAPVHGVRLGSAHRRWRATPTGPDLFQDPSGRLHALWSESSALRYRYATSTANTAWSALQTLVTGDSFAFKRLAVERGGQRLGGVGRQRGVRGVPLTRATTTPARRAACETTGFGGAYTLGVPRRCVSPGQRSA